MVFKLSEHKEKPDHMIRLFILNNVKQDFVPVVLGHIEHGVHVLAFTRTAQWNTVDKDHTVRDLPFRNFVCIVV